MNGLRNLLIGYDAARDDGDYFCSKGYLDDPAKRLQSTNTTCTGGGGTWAVSLKSGWHHLVIGDYNNYTQYGGVVVGSYNTSIGMYASENGGRNECGDRQRLQRKRWL